ncbi:TPA: hypothetical protein ACIBWY_004098, partial [Salmonella enterica subsp. enterica serovar Bullbay]
GVVHSQLFNIKLSPFLVCPPVSPSHSFCEHPVFAACYLYDFNFFTVDSQPELFQNRHLEQLFLP